MFYFTIRALLYIPSYIYWRCIYTKLYLLRVYIPSYIYWRYIYQVIFIEGKYTKLYLLRVYIPSYTYWRCCPACTICTRTSSTQTPTSSPSTIETLRGQICSCVVSLNLFAADDKAVGIKVPSSSILLFIFNLAFDSSLFYKKKNIILSL